MFYTANINAFKQQTPEDSYSFVYNIFNLEMHNVSESL